MLDIDYIENRANLLIPKLRSIENSGNSGMIHDCRVHICIIDAGLRNAKYYKDLKYIEACNKYLDKAEKYLLDIGKRL